MFNSSVVTLSETVTTLQIPDAMVHCIFLTQRSSSLYSSRLSFSFKPSQQFKLIVGHDLSAIGYYHTLWYNCESFTFRSSLVIKVVVNNSSVVGSHPISLVLFYIVLHRIMNVMITAIYELSGFRRSTHLCTNVNISQLASTLRRLLLND